MNLGDRHWRQWKAVAGIALVLAGAAWLFAALLYVDNRHQTEQLRTLSLAGCERQNRLRQELNQVLIGFDQRPAFAQINCPRAYEREQN
jgi:hypothetical protein